MKAELKPPVPVQQDVVLTLSYTEAQMLRGLAGMDGTIADAMVAAYPSEVKRDMVMEFLASIYDTLEDAGIRGYW